MNSIFPLFIELLKHQCIWYRALGFLHGHIQSLKSNFSFTKRDLPQKKQKNSKMIHLEMNLNECYRVVISITWNMEPVFVFLPKYFARHAALQNKYPRASQVSFKSKELIRGIMTISWGLIQHQNSIFHTKTFWKIRT